MTRVFSLVSYIHILMSLVRNIPLLKADGNVRFFKNPVALRSISEVLDNRTESDKKSKQEFFYGRVNRLKRGFEVYNPGSITANILGQNDEAVRRHAILLKEARKKNELEDARLLLRGSTLPVSGIQDALQAVRDSRPRGDDQPGPTPPPPPPPPQPVHHSVRQQLEGKKLPQRQGLDEPSTPVRSTIREQLIADLKEAQRSRSAPPARMFDAQGNILRDSSGNLPQRTVSPPTSPSFVSPPSTPEPAQRPATPGSRKKNPHENIRRNKRFKHMNDAALEKKANELEGDRRKEALEELAHRAEIRRLREKKKDA